MSKITAALNQSRGYFGALALSDAAAELAPDAEVLRLIRLIDEALIEHGTIEVLIKVIDTFPQHSVHRHATAEMVEHKCSDHPDAPHGFDRNASHNAGHYVCECEGWTPEVTK